MNGTANGFALNWIDNKTALSTDRLIINGRLMTHNTRGGSLDIILSPIMSGTALCALGMTIGGCSYDLAAAQDLERFRFILLSEQ